MTTTQPPGTTVTIASPISGDFNDLVPLLTTFTPPRSCENSWVYSTEAKGTVWKDGDHNDDYGYSCLPFGGQNYKPGICPSGQEFKSVDRTVEDPGDEGSYAPTWWVGLCCSSQYRLSFREHFTESLQCLTGLVPPIIAELRESVTDEDSMTTQATTINTAVVGVEDAISITWMESDLTYFPLSVANSFKVVMGLTPATAMPSMTATSAQSASSTGPSPPEVAFPLSTEGLPLGAIIGIGFGGLAFLALLLSVFYLACHRRHRHEEGSAGSNTGGQAKRRGWFHLWRGRGKPSTGNANGGEVGLPELQDTQTGRRMDPYYLAQRHGELLGSPVSAQSRMVVELDTNPPRGSGVDKEL